MKTFQKFSLVSVKKKKRGRQGSRLKEENIGINFKGLTEETKQGAAARMTNGGHGRRG